MNVPLLKASECEPSLINYSHRSNVQECTLMFSENVEQLIGLPLNVIYYKRHHTLSYYDH